MKLHLKGHVLAVLLFCLFSGIFSGGFITQCHAQFKWRKDSKYNKSDFTFEWVVKKGEYSILIGDTSQVAHLKDILGTWEDENGTRIKLYVGTTNQLDTTDTFLHHYFNAYGVFPENFTHVILADVEFWTFSGGTYCKNWKKVNGKGLLAVLFNVDGPPEIKELTHGCDRVRTPYWLVRSNDTITEYSAPGLTILTRSMSWTPQTKFNYNTGDLYKYHRYYPTPLIRTSVGHIDFGETTLKPETEYAIKIYSTPKRVVPDGESTVEITAILYEYLPGDENSNKRLAGKTINFVLDEYSEFKAGKLSATTAVTDADGQARVIFTAPTGERLQEAPSLKLTSTVNAVCEEFEVDDKAYISYILDDGKVMVEPTPAVISSEGIVPPDKRFPAVIRAYFEDENLNSLTNTKVRFWIDELSPVGMLRGPGGVEGTEVELITDEQGFAEVQYYYAAEKQLIRPITERIKITSEQMATPLEARITVGMNIIFDLVENAYEGKGELNAGEQIPIRVKIKLAEYPNLDLSAFLNYWASNEETGDKLLVKLEIDKISTVPTYLVQRLSLEDPPEPGFSENMTVRSFKDKGELNYLWVPYSSLEGYIGYPKISPQTIGTHYYEAHLTLTDQDGKAIFEADHPARTAFFNIETGMSTDLGQIFFLSNPFRQDTKESQLCGAALGVMGMGTFMSVNDALHMINTGDVDGLFSILFSEVKGGILDKVKVGDAYKELAVDLYTGMALAEKVGLEILKDQTGPITAMEGAIFEQLHKAFSWKAGQIVILRGFGEQKLFEVLEPEEKEKDAGKSNFALAISGSESKPAEESNASNKKEIPTEEKGYKVDEKRKTSSLKNGYISIYIIPADMKISHENAIEMKRY